MKIDVEGFEFEVLEGASETLKVTDALMIEVSAIRRPQNEKSSIRHLMEVLDRYDFKIIELVTNFLQPDGSPAEYNILARK